MQDLNIAITNVDIEIPNFVLVKLINNEIDTVEKVLDISIDEFLQLKNIGKKAVAQLTDLKIALGNKFNVDYVVTAKREPLIVLSKDSQLAGVEFEKITALLKKILLNKFKENGIRTIGQLENITLQDFSNFAHVGKSVVGYLAEFINDLKENPQIYLAEYTKNTLVNLVPKKVNYESKFVENFKNFVDEYLILIKRLASKDEIYQDSLKKFFGLNGGKRYTLSQIGALYEKTDTRIEQIRNNLIEDLNRISSGNTSKCSELLSVNLDFAIMLSDFKCNLQEVQVISMKKFFELNLPTAKTRNFKGYLELFLRMNAAVVSGSAESEVTLGRYIFFDRSIDKNSHLAVIKNMFDILRTHVIPIEETDLFLELAKFQKINRQSFNLILKTTDNIDLFEKNDKRMIQISFELLPAAGDLAERILYEKGESTHISELIEEAVNRLHSINAKKRKITKSAVAKRLLEKPYLEAKGKTGYYFFKEWGENNDIYKDLIHKIILDIGQPASIKEIVHRFQSERPNSNEGSIRSITNEEFNTISNGMYVVDEWAHKYKNEIKTKKLREKRSKTRLEEVIEVFEREGVMKILRKDLTKILKSEYGFPSVTISSVIINNDCFERHSDFGQKFILFFPDRIVKKESVTNMQKIRHEIKIFFSQKGIYEYKLNEFVKIISSRSKVEKQQVYKFLDKNKFEYIKSKKEKKHYISLAKHLLKSDAYK